jgi:hypothetical protein
VATANPHSLLHSDVFILDTSVFIQAARSYYAFDLVPTFWTHLAKLFQKKLLISIDRVKKEIDRGKDELKKWASQFPDLFQKTDDPDVLQSYQRVMQWAYAHPQYTSEAKAEFARADNADAWVVAFALAKGGIVVSQETSSSASKTKIKIPDVCEAFGISCITTFDMLRRLGITI